MHANIALTGRSGSGKTTVAEYLVERHGYARASTGDACRSVCHLLFGFDSKTIMNAVTDALKDVQNDVWISAALRTVPSHQPIVFDSMRFQLDYDELVKKGFTTWRIESAASVRHERLRVRGQEFDPEVDEIHRCENELCGNAVDFQIANNGSLADLYKSVEEALGFPNR